MQEGLRHVWSLCLVVLLTLIHAYARVFSVLAGGSIPHLCSKFADQVLSHVQLWRTAIEYPASNSSQCGMPIFGCCIFLHGKKKNPEILLTALLSSHSQL